MFFVIFWNALVRYTWPSNSSRFFPRQSVLSDVFGLNAPAVWAQRCGAGGCHREASWIKTEQRSRKTCTCFWHILNAHFKGIKIICFVGFGFVSVNETWTELLRAGTVFFSQSYSISNAPASIQEARFRSPSLGIHQLHSKSWNHVRSPTYASFQKGWWCVVTNCACTMYIVHVPFSSDQQCVSFKCVELVRMRSLAMESAKMVFLNESHDVSKCLNSAAQVAPFWQVALVETSVCMCWALLGSCGDLMWSSTLSIVEWWDSMICSVYSVGSHYI